MRRDAIQKQVTLLDEAVARDPAFVPALCMLAQAHLQAYWFKTRSYPGASGAGEQGARSSGTLATRRRRGASGARLFHYWGSRDYAPALAELALARRSLPNDAEVLVLIGLIERRQGRWEESTETLERAFVLDPRNASMVTSNC